MYESILEYIVNADLFYRLWMVAQMQSDGENWDTKDITFCRENWMPELVGMFDDVRNVPGVIRCTDAKHILDTDLRFHTGNKTPTINIPKMELFWGVGESEVFRVTKNDGHVLFHPMRKTSPCKVTISNMKFWHHQDSTHRRRGDAIICDQTVFEWNTKENSGGSFRENGPFRVIIKGFRAAYNMGVSTSASYAHLGVSWGTENGIRLGEEKVQDVINKNGISVNYLMADSAFGDEGEEFIFWDEIGRAQEDAA